MVAGIVVRSSRVLLVHNTKHGRMRAEPPGGKLHPGEGWEEALVREFREELGVEVRPASVFGTFDTQSPEGEFSVRMYLCEITRGEPRVCEPDKVPGFGWYTAEDLDALWNDGVLVPNMVEAMDELKGLLAGE